MNKLFKIHWLAALCGLTMLSLTACNDDDNPENKSPEVNPDINVNVENVLIRRIPNLSMVWDRFISAIHV